MEVGGLKGKVGTRRRFPQVSGDLRVRWCSPVLKIDVAAIAINNEPAFKRGKRLLFLTGERREEGRNGQGRALYAEREPHRCDRSCRRVDAWRSVIDWPEVRVWQTMQRWRIRPHPAYRLGFPRVSCQTCIFGGPDQWASVRQISPERFARILAYERLFGSTIKHGLDVEQVANRGTPYPECNDLDLVRLALSPDYPGNQVLVPSEEAWQLPAGAFKRGGGPT